MQQREPEDFVIATGEQHSVQEFLELAFDRVSLDWRKYVDFDERYLRPAEVDLLIGNSSKARRLLQWEPRINFGQLVSMMVDADLELAWRERRSAGV
jgi:GDPmannose 4,6-dehydratase